jgi:hypothetical protein
MLGDIVHGVFTPVLANHSKSFSLIDCISVGVDRMHRETSSRDTTSSATNDLESLQCLHLCIQGIGADPAVQGPTAKPGEFLEARFSQAF